MDRAGEQATRVYKFGDPIMPNELYPCIIPGCGKPTNSHYVSRGRYICHACYEAMDLKDPQKWKDFNKHPFGPNIFVPNVEAINLEKILKKLDDEQ